MAPIEGTTPEEAADRFVQHLNYVLRRTITNCRLRRIHVGKHFQIAFEEEDAPAKQIELSTGFGTMWLYLGQVCETAQVTKGVHRLRTRAYKYTLTRENENTPLFRWEFVRYPTRPDAEWCRHHLQGAISLPLETRHGTLSLDDVHLPTGYVPVEEVIRFCIADLGVNAQRGWHDELEESYRKFREEFAEFGSI